MLTLENEGSWMEITPPIKCPSIHSVFAELRVYIEELHFQICSNQLTYSQSYADNDLTGILQAMMNFNFGFTKD